MADESTEKKKAGGISFRILILGCLVSLFIGVVAGTFASPKLKALAGIVPAEEPAAKGEFEDEPSDISQIEPGALFAPMPGVFSPDKERFYADAGEFLVAIKFQGRTRYLQLTVQLVGHDEEFMGKVETDVPAIRNGVSIFFSQQDFSSVSTLEGRESLRLATLVEINKIIGATKEKRVADVYFTDYITQ